MVAVCGGVCLGLVIAWAVGQLVAIMLSYQLNHCGEGFTRTGPHHTNVCITSTTDCK